MNWDMLLKMTLATLLYVLITTGVWLFCRKRETFGTGLKILIGLIYGATCVAANHIGIDYGSLVLNVRDIAPLTAGLFFSPLSGVIAGVIGGVERFLAGELWGIGKFTEVACSVSTCLAGLLAALLNRKVYKGERPSVLQAFLIGAVMEVFHMYAVLFTNRDSMTQAYYVVRVAAVPMILFTAAGTALCALASKVMNGEKPQLRIPQEETPMDRLFQRRLLVVTAVLFLFNFIVSYSFQTRLVAETASMEIDYISMESAEEYKKTGDIDKLLQHLGEQHEYSHFFIVVDLETGEYRTDDRFNDPDQTAAYGEAEHRLSTEDLEIVNEHLDRVPFISRLGTFENEEAMCSVRRLDANHALVTLRATGSIYENRDAQMYESTLSDILIFTVLYVLISMLVDHLVVKNLNRVNVSLDKITSGKLDEEVWVRPSSEFSELSDDINKTVTALKGYIDAAEQRMKDELKFAAEIQDAALPKNFGLPTEKIELYALMTPAKEVGGDFYDFFYAGIDLLVLVIADVSGKGVPASLFMMRAKTAIKNFARTGYGPAEMLENVNTTLCEGNDAEMFVTVWVGILDLKTGLMKCANAGHEYPVLMRAGGDYELLRDKHGLPLAAIDQVKMKEYEIQLDPGDRLFVYTDGVPEAVNEKNEQYGTDRMTEKLTRLKGGDQKWMLEGLLQDIRNFAGQAEQFDDITMLGITYKG